MSTLRDTDTEDGRVDTRIDPPANVLLLAPAMTPDEDAVCCDLLTPRAPSEEDVLCVSFTRSPDDNLDMWRTHVGSESPDRMGVVSVGDTARSAAQSQTGSIDAGGPVGGLRIETVSSPSDLTGLGIRMSTMLSDWEHTGNQPVVCFNSITTLLQYADLERVFRFLHVATGRLESVGALAHFHLDPDAHDEQTLNTLLSLFDTSIRYDDGQWAVRNR